MHRSHLEKCDILKVHIVLSLHQLQNVGTLKVKRAASWEGGAVDGGSVKAFLAAALARVMRVAVPIPAVASASVFHSAAGVDLS